MAITNLEDKIEKLYKEGNKVESTDSHVSKIPLKNVEVLITHMIKQNYEWEEIVAVSRVIKKGKAEDLIKIIKDTIS